MNQAKLTFDNIYESYKNMIYGIALEVSPSAQEAEEIMVSTFVKVHRDNIPAENHPSICISLIKTVIQTAHERLHPGQSNNNFKIRYFEKTPLLHSMFCGQLNIDKYCMDNGVGRAEAALILREEFNSLRSFKN
jgi:hypothetical protein